MNLIERLRDPGTEVSREECAHEIERLTAELALCKKYAEEMRQDALKLQDERDALRSALQLIKANTNTLDWPDDINAAIQGAGK